LIEFAVSDEVGQQIAMEPQILGVPSVEVMLFWALPEDGSCARAPEDVAPTVHAMPGFDE
jgi:hypothetical protein